MIRDEIAEEMAESFEKMILACEYDSWPEDQIKPYRDVLRRYRSRHETKIPAQRFMAFWNGCPPLPMIQTMSEDRKIHLVQRAQEDFFVLHWQEGIQRIARSSFCIGKIKAYDGRHWRATADWFLRPGSLAKIMEGKYDDQKPAGIARKNSVVHTESMVDDAKKWRESQWQENDGLPAF